MCLLRGNGTEILAQEMKGRLCFRGTELRPQTCASHGGLFSSHPFPLIPLSHTLTFCQYHLPKVDPPSILPPNPSTPIPPSKSWLSFAAQSQWTVSKWPPLSMALSCCDLTAIKCQIKLMDSHCQGAYTT